VQLLVDGTLSNDAAITLNYANQAIAGFNRRMANERGSQAALAAIPLDLRIRAWYNPKLEGKFYYVPGLIAVMLILIGLVLTSMAIVREKEIGTIEQVMVTPIRRLEFIVGKTLPFLVTGMVTMTLMFIIARLIFGIRIEGSLPLLYLAAMIYVTGNLGLALLVSVTAKTQQQALLTAFFILVPAILLSGFIFPIHNMPPVIQWLTVLNPMRWFLQILHGIVVKGVGLHTLWQPLGAMTLLALSFLTLAVTRFKKTLE
jgi:ABC-2 type transport system permease protein